MRILGMASHTHDTGVALVCDGVPEVVIEEERLNRQKKTLCFPALALDAAITDRGLSLADIDAITIPWDIPRFRRTLAGAILRKFPRSLNLIHMRAHPPQENHLFRGIPYLARLLRAHFGTDRLPPIHGIGHHDSHAAEFFVSPFEEATVLVMDGYGDDASTSVYTGYGNRLNRRWHTKFFNSLGILYTVVTQHMGFLANCDEGKVMGLAAYGEPTYLDAFGDVLRTTPDGRYQINMDYFDFDSYGLARAVKPKFCERFGPPRQEGDELTEHHRDLAFALQATIERTIVHLVRGLTRDFPSRNLCLVGGVALNCVANYRILAETDIQRVWIPPNASDTGATFGSALWHYHQQLERPREFVLRHAAYGLDYDEDRIEEALQKMGMCYERLDDAVMYQKVATDLAAGRIVGWFRGRFEMGPRALGNRSILADPRRAIMKDILNARVKHRESFRPFAPAILEEHLSDWFEMDQPDPFMTIAPPVRAEKSHQIPASVHQDGTGRVQTVSRTHNPGYYDVIEEFHQLTGVPMVLNTSFNRQEPIVATPEEAVSCFLRTDMDVLALGNFYCAQRNDEATERATTEFRALEEAIATW